MSPHLVVTPVFFACFVAAFSLPPAIVAADVPPLPVTSAPAVVTSVSAAAALWPDLVDDTTAVLVEGVVTGTMPNGAFRLHDGELGIYITRTVAGQALKPGDRVRIRGVLRKGGFSPWILPHDVVVLGRGEFPEAPSASYPLLASGVADNQWLEVEGVVRAAEMLDARDFVMLDLAMMGGNLRVFKDEASCLIVPGAESGTQWRCKRDPYLDNLFGVPDQKGLPWTASLARTIRGPAAFSTFMLTHADSLDQRALRARYLGGKPSEWFNWQPEGISANALDLGAQGSVLIAACPYGRKLESADLSTDAELAVVLLSPEGKVRDWAMARGSSLIVRGKKLVAGKQREFMAR